MLAGNGGFVVGSPRWPSIEWMRAVSSPQTNAPAPSLISMSKQKSVPRMFLLQTMYFSSAFTPAAIFHLRPVGKPAPPRPQMPESSTSCTTSIGFISVSALARPW